MTDSFELLKKKIQKGEDFLDNTLEAPKLPTLKPVELPKSKSDPVAKSASLPAGDFSSLEELLKGSEENVKVESANINAPLVDLNTEGATGAITADAGTGDEGNKYLTGSGAKMYVMTFDLLGSRLASAWAKESNYEKFKLTPTERKDFEAVCATYFDSVQIKISPTFIFVMLNVLFLGGTMWKAYTMRKIKMEAIQRKKTHEKKAEAKAAITTGQIELFDSIPEGEKKEVQEAVKEVFNNALLSTKRGRFEIDKNGYYTMDENGKYVPAAERIEEAPEDIKELLREGKKNGEIKLYVKEIMMQQLKQ